MTAHLEMGASIRVPLSAPVITPDRTGISLGGTSRDGVVLAGMSPQWIADLRTALDEYEATP